MRKRERQRGGEIKREKERERESGLKREEIKTEGGNQS